MSHSRPSGTAGAEQSPQQSGVAGGILSKLKPYIRRGTESGALSLGFAVAMLARLGQAILKGEKLGAVMHALMAKSWIVIGVVQRRTFGQGTQGGQGSQ